YIVQHNTEIYTLSLHDALPIFSEQQIQRPEKRYPGRITMSLSNVFDIAGSGMNAQSIRINTTASNIANAESASSSVDETYRARKDRKSTRLNSSHVKSSYAFFC